MSHEKARWIQYCAYCGTPLAVGGQHPMYTERETDGSVQLYSFCDRECKET